MIIDKVITIWLDSDAMEEINKITGIDAFSTDNWVDYSVVEGYSDLKQYVTNENLEALKNGKADYIAFRIDY
ncbi:TPA: hypothetical protein CPT98_07160 [Candidatus Gastranaerophilales bacterium HUM_19]|jgi:hypothetical protein|nr:MAG TPA: hypothetical protein CPT98_07160 [Candidatus Gastranaerophilales bacterium HUM_19]DAB19528.1 MAG TPA: hypothetical protein CPT97_02065 [Candidatus Gastranaerophilales bacterium HUM_17]DAB26118.1 MAG TPA: hypothetical protein CPT86_03785 [Candidatus Gastranaerophilales bacterium HUM_23]